MTTLRIRIESADDIEAAVRTAAEGAASDEAGLSFVSYEQMHRILSPKRLEILRCMTGAAPMSIREISRRVGRDFKAVHGDVTALVVAGVLDRDAHGVAFHYDALHFEFDILAAA